jgi:hypothetical protein
MIEQEHDCGTEGFALVPRIGGGRVWLELCPDCGPHVGDQVLRNDGELCRVDHLQPGGPWPNWTPGLTVRPEARPYCSTFISAGWGYRITKRREELVAERLMA